jgi:tRNA U34 5-methylaminomethyl-2-thiouridine-forming methyltransferase MnmC
MERKLIVTTDGSHTISIPEMDVTYHSIHGAIQESLHVFIEAGFRNLPGWKDPDSIERNKKMDPVNILEMGFGTGLNALLTLIDAAKAKRTVHYLAIELYPLSKDEVEALNFCSQLHYPSCQPQFEKLHHCEWEKDIVISPYFIFHKTNTSLQGYLDASPSPGRLFDLVYFDAFAPAAQPELWSREIFEKLNPIMQQGGVLVTYCSKGDVRRNMIAAGFKVQKIPGPAGKREMLRAIK